MFRKKSSMMSMFTSGGGGGGGSVVTGDRRGSKEATESMAETNSQTDETYMMTKDEINYQYTEEENTFLEEVNEELKKRLVFGDPSRSFGLKWKIGGVNEFKFVLGGWLSQCTRSMIGGGSVSNGKVRFFVLDDKKKEFKQSLDEEQKTRKSLNYDDITTVRPRFQKPSTWFIQIYAKNKRWELTCVDNKDRDTLLRWVCALQLRTNTFDASLEYDIRRALKVVIFLQCKYRVWKAKQRVAKKRAKRAQLTNRLKSSLASLTGWEFAEEDTDEDDEGGYSGYLGNVAGSFATSVWGAVGSWLGLGGVTPTEREEEDDPFEDKKKEERRNSTFVQANNDLPPLLVGEEEDEIWENQRWNPVGGWVGAPGTGAERCAFTDRVGRGNFPNPAKAAVPLPSKNWKTTSEFKVDLSGITKGRCDKEGWTYATDWRILDSDLSKGKYVAHNPGGLSGYVVRRRRYYRRRLPISSNNNNMESTSPIIAQGWLGCKSDRSGRWASRYYVLTRPGLAIGTIPHTLESKTNAVLQAPRGPVLTYFRFSFKDYEKIILDGGMDPVLWRNLTPKQATSIELDPRLTALNEAIATPSKPGYFSMEIRENPQKKNSAYATPPGEYLFNASGGTIARQNWVALIQTSLKESLKAGRPRTLRLVGGAFETTSYLNIIMDLFLLAPVNEVEKAAFQEDSFINATLIREKVTNVNISPWSEKNDRVITYEHPTHGPVKETWTRARTEPGKGFIIDRLVSAPSAQFGNEYNTKVRTVIVAAEMPDGKDNKLVSGCRVLVSIDFEFLAQTMMVGYITSTNKREISAFYEDKWLPCMLGSLKGKGIIVEEPLKDSAVSTTKTLAKFNKSNSGHIEVQQAKSKT